MAAEVVATRRRIIPRPRLTKLLDESPARIKLLVAPAGYGKTTLAQQWLDVPERRDVWYRGGPASADVAALAAGIAVVASAIVPDAGKRMRERLRATGHAEDDVEILAELLAEDLERWPAEAWLVIDDYQFAMESVASERFIEFLVQHPPIQVVLASRLRPTWATARRILYGEVQEIERRQLAMETEEAMSVIGRDDDNVAALLTRAQGWPAVIGLAANAAGLDLPRQGLPPALYDYLAEELYQRLDAQFQMTLCKLCVAPIVTPGIQRVLFGHGDDPQIESAVRLGVLHDQDGSYEIHPLLRSFLEPKLLSLDVDQVEELATAVIDHLFSVGSWDEAYDVIERFGILSRLDDLVTMAIEEIVETGRISTLAQWLNFASRHHLTSPILDYAEAELAFRQGRYGTASALASNAARTAHESEYEPSLRARILLRAGQSALLDSRERDALDHFRAARAIAPRGPLQRESLVGEFFASVDLGLDGADRLLAELDEISSRGPEDLVRMSIAHTLYAERSGGLFDALAQARDIYPLLDRIVDPIIKTSFLNTFGQSLALTGHYEEAFNIAEEGAAVASEYRLQFVLSHAAILRTMAAIGLRDVSLALTAIAEAEQSSDDAHIGTNVAILRARLSLLRGAPEEALAILRSPLKRHPSDALNAEYLGSRSLAAVAAGDFRLASEACDRIMRAPRYTRGGTTTATLVKAILALHNEPDTYNTLVENALSFVFKGGRLDEFVVVYRSFPQVLASALSTSEYGTAAIALVGRANDARVARQLGFSITTPLAGRVGSLTPRENEVLVLVARGLTNKDIARELVISESTVKVHIRHLLEKLGAETRTEAASRIVGVFASGD
jgi:LuxR family transcriptional regulator, maltose regulon positive regulatory protein